MITLSAETEHWLRLGMKGWDASCPELRRLVVEFALMWQLIEGKLFKANFAKWRRGQPGRDSRPEDWPSFDLALPETLQAWDHFSGRYGGSDSHDGQVLFDRLMNGRDPSMRLLIAKGLGLTQAQPSDAEKRQALMLVIYRLRNNLFHGGKGQSGLAGQEDNLRHAVHVMRAICKANPSNFEVQGD